MSVLSNASALTQSNVAHCMTKPERQPSTLMLEFSRNSSAIKHFPYKFSLTRTKQFVRTKSCQFCLQPAVGIRSSLGLANEWTQQQKASFQDLTNPKSRAGMFFSAIQELILKYFKGHRITKWIQSQRAINAFTLENNDKKKSRQLKKERSRLKI